MLHAEVTSPVEWMRACSTAFVPLRVRSMDAQFEASLEQVELAPGVTLTSVTSHASDVVRDHAVIAANPREDILLSLHRKGGGAVSQHGRTARMVPGAAVLYDASEPYTLSFPGQMSEIVLQLPRRAVSRVGHAFEDLTARPLQSGGPLRALAALAGSVRPEVRARERIEDEAVAQSLFALLLAALAVERASAPPIEGDLLAMALRLHVDEHASDPALTPQSLADAFHISLRYAQKLFSREDEAPATYIRLRRLEIAQRELRAGAAVATAAYRSGFTDVDTFSRAFKREFGAAPSRYR